MNDLEALEKSVELLGGQTKLAKVCGSNVTQQHVWNWLRRNKKLPEKYALTVQKATRECGEMVRASELCPGVFPKGEVAY